VYTDDGQLNARCGGYIPGVIAVTRAGG